MALSSVIPANINFRTLSDGRIRIYFLSTPPNGWETTLLYVDIAQTDDITPKRCSTYQHCLVRCVPYKNISYLQTALELAAGTYDI